MRSYGGLTKKMRLSLRLSLPSAHPSRVEALLVRAEVRSSQGAYAEADVLAAGTGALIVLGFSLPATAVWQVCGGALRGSGDTRSPMLASVVATWLAVALALIAVREFGAGLSVVWLMYTITTHLAALSNWVALRRRLATYRFTLP